MSEALVPERHIRIDWLLPGNEAWEMIGIEQTLDEAIAFTESIRSDDDNDGVKLRYVEITEITILTTTVIWAQ